MQYKLFMLLLGCKPKGRNTEQHDIFFGIAAHLKALSGDIADFWPEVKGKIHIDAWREVNYVDGFKIEAKEKPSNEEAGGKEKLFFLNLGGYKKDDFEEYHYKILQVCGDKGAAIQRAKQTAFYQHTGFEGAVSHIDDKYGVDVDDIYEIADILPQKFKEQYSIIISKADAIQHDELHLGYLTLEKLKGNIVSRSDHSRAAIKYKKNIIPLREPRVKHCYLLFSFPSS
ncbi:MAG: DUF1543 domain-containing protein [Terrimonas sp.]|nr:DUF1543 domain-containing protein [Terrimonas sp.]OJY81332.1 MAG: hypothetical protein BGP13_15130 [Sphingobacteriales bacterium 40-81]